MIAILQWIVSAFANTYMTSFSRKMTVNKYNQFSVYVNELYLGENENTFYANDCRKQILFVS